MHSIKDSMSKIGVILLCLCIAACASMPSSPTTNTAKRYSDNVCIVTEDGLNIFVMMKKGMLAKSKSHLFSVELTALSEPGAAYIEHGEKFYSTVFTSDDVWFGQRPVSNIERAFGAEVYELNSFKQGPIEIQTAKRAYNQCLQLPVVPEKAANNLAGNMIRTDYGTYFFMPDGNNKLGER